MLLYQCLLCAQAKSVFPHRNGLRMGVCTRSGWFSSSVLRGTALQGLHSVLRTDQYCMASWVDHVLRLPGWLAAVFL
jgi:hypothetical protein